MERLNIYFLEELSQHNSLSLVACHLRGLQKQAILNAPWPAFPYKPAAYFTMSYTDHWLFLQYVVKENFIQAIHGRTNEPVYRDSCVEFFISFDNGSTYYNFEFNCIGTVLAGFGKGRENRELLPEEVLHKLRLQVVINKGGEKSPVCWELTVSIPFEVFLYHSLDSLKGQSCRANFCKCGDELPEPHFLSWSAIESNEPNFHLPEFFGTLDFK